MFSPKVKPSTQRGTAEGGSQSPKTPATLSGGSNAASGRGAHTNNTSFNRKSGAASTKASPKVSPKPVATLAPAAASPREAPTKSNSNGNGGGNVLRREDSRLDTAEAQQDSPAQAVYRTPAGEWIVRGVKYFFDADAMRWSVSEVVLLLRDPDRGIGQDDLRVSFAVEQLVVVSRSTRAPTRVRRMTAATLDEEAIQGFINEGTSSEGSVFNRAARRPVAGGDDDGGDSEEVRLPMVAKMFRHNVDHVTEEDYYGEVQCQALAEEFVHYYHTKPPVPGVERPPLPLLTHRTLVRLTDIPPEFRAARRGFFSYRTVDSRELLLVLEPNAAACAELGLSYGLSSAGDAGYRGRVYAPAAAWVTKAHFAELAEAFSHFTYTESGESLLVCGMRRAMGYLLDPIVHTTDGHDFGMLNGGLRRMANWITEHRCNHVCRSLGLRPLLLSYLGAAPISPELDVPPRFDYFAAYTKQLRVAPPSFTSEGGSSTLTPANAAGLPDQASEGGVYSGRKSQSDDRSSPSPFATPTHATAEGAGGGDGQAVVAVRARLGLQPGGSADDVTEVAPAPSRAAEAGAAPPKRMVISRADRQRAVDSSPDNDDLVPPPPRLAQQSKHQQQHQQASVPPAVVKEGRLSGGSIEGRRSGSSMSSDGLPRREPRVRRMSNMPAVVPARTAPRRVVEKPVPSSAAAAKLREKQRDKVAAHRVQGHQDPAATATEDALEQSRREVEFLSRDDGAVVVSRRKDAHRPTAAAAAAANASPKEEVIQVKRRPSSATVPPTHSPPTATATAAATNTGGSSTREAGGGAPSPEPERRQPSAVQSSRRGSATTSSSMRRASTATVRYVFRGTKHFLDPKTQAWAAQPVTVRIVNPAKGLAQGGMRACFEVMELVAAPGGASDAVEEVAMVAKMYRRTISNVRERDYFTEVEMQHFCGQCAGYFNKALAGVAVPTTTTTSSSSSSVSALTAENAGWSPLPFEFVCASVVVLDRAEIPAELLAKRTGFFSYRSSDTHQLIFSMEEKLEGPFTKYNSNFGHAFDTPETPLPRAAAEHRFRYFEAAEAFTHFTLVESEGGLLVCDIQGVDNLLTDPEVHSYDANTLGMGNSGSVGICQFRLRHRCNDVCRALGMRPTKMQRFPAITPEIIARNAWLQAVERLQQRTSMGVPA